MCLLLEEVKENDTKREQLNQDSDNKKNEDSKKKEDKNSHILTPISYLEVESIYTSDADVRGIALQKTLEDIHLDEKREDEAEAENDHFILHTS